MKTKLTVAAMGALLATAQAHAAGSATGTLGVRLAVQPTCSIAAAGALVDFGVVPAGTTATDLNADTLSPGSNSMTISCTNGGTTTPPVLTYGPGLNDVGPVRNLASATGAKIVYEIYADAGHTKLRAPGDTTAFAQNLPDGDTDFNEFFLRIPAGQTLPAGDFSDTVLITIDF